MIKIKFNHQFKSFFVISLMLFLAQLAQASDPELAAKLKNELEFETKRRNDFKNHRQGQSTYEHEREKGLSLFLEEQEKWDQTREKGLAEQRASRIKNKEMDEKSPEYIQDQKEKKKYQAELEISRKKQIETKQQVIELFKNRVNVTEEEELGVYSSRPRYALRMRGKNKWSAQSKSGSGSFGGNSGGSWDGGGNSVGTTPTPFDYPPIPNQDYIPSDNFDDLPPPPPMLPYDGYSVPGGGGLDGNFDFPPPTGYPPPPPDGGWDF